MTHDELVLCLMQLPYPEHISDIRKHNVDKSFFTWRDRIYSVSLSSILVVREMDDKDGFFIGDNEAILMEGLLKRIYINLKIEKTDNENNL